MTDRPERVPVERLHVGDEVQAIPHGPKGVVEDANRYGWTIVQYPGNRHGDGVMPYKHGQDRLIVINATSDDIRRGMED